MSLPSDQYFTNAIAGQMMAGADVNIYRVDTAAKYAIGQGFTRGDGNIFRYASFDAAVAVGRVVAPVVANSGLTTLDNKVIDPASATAVAAEYPILPGQVGSRYVQLTVAAIAADKYQGGYLITEDGSGEGYTYRIKGNTATGNPVSGDLYLQLHEPLQVRLSPNTDVMIMPSLFNDVDVASAATNWACAGVNMAAMTAGSFGWVCTKGSVGVLQDGTITGGDQVALSTAVSGAVAAYGAGTTNVGALTGVQILGYAIGVGADTEFATVFLQL